MLSEPSELEPIAFACTAKMCHMEVLHYLRCPSFANNTISYGYGGFGIQMIKYFYLFYHNNLSCQSIN